MTRKLLKYGLGLAAVILLFGYALERVPPPWWDEGWTLMVARTWVEQGVYGRMLNGQIAPPGLESAFPTAWLAALSMRVFGVGLAQARWVSVLLTCGAIALLFFLARRLYNRTVAWATLVVLFGMVMHPQMHVLLMGRQLLGEAAMLCALTAGLVLLWYAERCPLILAPLIGLVWSVGLLSKAQPAPFLALSIGGVVLAALWLRQFRVAAIFFASGVWTFVLYNALLALWAWFNSKNGIAYASLDGLFQVLAIVTVPEMRWKALTLVLQFDLLPICGVGYGLATWFRTRRAPGFENFIRLWLALFVASWLGWFLALANSSISRYLYPPTFFGALFAAAMLDAWTRHFDVRETLRRASTLVRWRRPQARALGALAAIFFAALAFPFTLFVLTWAFWFDANQDAQNTAAYLNTQTAPTAQLETYDAELFFFLKRPYHYPPDQLHVEYIRRTIDPQHPVQYNALQADPDYLVVGPFSQDWRVYAEVLAQGVFTPTTRFGAYQIYQRVR